MIADACAEVGVRVVCAYGVTDRHGADGARRGLEENRRFLAEGGRGLVGLHAAFTCSDETIAAAAGWRATTASASTSTWPRVPTTPTPSSGWPPHATDDWLLVHGVHLPDDHGLPGTVVHNPRSNMNNAVGYARPARVRQPGRPGHRRHRRRHARGVPPGLRPAPGERRPGHARHAVVLAGGGPDTGPRGGRRPGHLGRRRHGPVVAGLHHRRPPAPGRGGRRGGVGRRAADPGRRRRDPGHRPLAPRIP